MSSIPISELIMTLIRENIYIAVIEALFIAWIIDSKKRENSNEETYKLLADKVQNLSNLTLDLKGKIEINSLQIDTIDENAEEINKLLNSDIKITLNTIQTIINERLYKK